ncbi:MAG: GerMN domain-containing protein [Myxococcales bacterium]
MTVKVWFLDDERMKSGEEPMFVPVERSVPKEAPIKGALDALFAGPIESEKARGLRFVASGATGFEGLRVENGVAHMRLVGGCNSGGSTVTIANELRPTLKQFEEVEFVKIYDPSGKTEEPEGRTDSIPFCLEP